MSSCILALPEHLKPNTSLQNFNIINATYPYLMFFLCVPFDLFSMQIVIEKSSKKS